MCSQGWPFNSLSPRRDLGLRNFANPDANVLGLQPTKPWNGQRNLTSMSIMFHLSTLLIPTTHTIPSSLQDFAFRDFTNPIARIMGLQFMKPRNRNVHANPTVSVGLNIWFYLSWAWTFGNTCCNSPTPPWDLTTHETSWTLHREFRSSFYSLENLCTN